MKAVVFELKQKVFSYEQRESLDPDSDAERLNVSCLDQMKFCTVVESLEEKICELMSANRTLQEANSKLENFIAENK